MKTYLPKILVLAIGGVLAMSSFHVRSQSERSSTTQSSTTLSAKTKLQQLLGKHSALPLVGEFDEAPVETQEDHQRRQERQRRCEGLFSRRILDPGTQEVNSQAETFNVTFIDGVTILKPGERPDPPGLPIPSAAVVIGTAVSGKAYVSEDHTYVYSEYKIAVNEVVKPDPETAIAIGGEITTWRPWRLGTLSFGAH